MKIIVCIDDKYGISWNNKRVSKDRKIIEDIEFLNVYLHMNNYSYKMFEEYGYNKTINISDNIVSESGFYFNELSDLKKIEKEIDEIIVYKFNRSYPSDIKLDIDLSKYILRETKEFIGNSHKKITREIYIRSSI